MNLKRRTVFGLRRSRINFKLFSIRVSIATVMVRLAEMQNEGASEGRLRLVREKLNFFKAREHRQLTALQKLYGANQSRADR